MKQNISKESTVISNEFQVIIMQYCKQYKFTGWEIPFHSAKLNIFLEFGIKSYFFNS